MNNFIVNEIKKYTKQNLTVFSVDIKQKKHKNGIWKKDVIFPSKWTDFQFKKSFIDINYNGLALLTGKINNIVVIDIDNVDHWKNLLQKNNQHEPETVKAKSGSGGIHLFFKYNEDLEDITSKDHCFDKEYDIDIKTNGGCVICPPSKYYNNNLNREVEYVWERNIYENELLEMPNWMKKLLFKKKTIKNENNKNNKNNNNNNNNNNNKEIQEYEIIEINEENSNLNFNDKDIEILLNMLDEKRCDLYNDWINVGFCLFNINEKYLHLWKKWSLKSEKYEDGSCDLKWKTFKKDQNGLKIGTLLMWCKIDNCEMYESFMKNHKLKEMIISKFPHANLELGETIKISDNYSVTNLHNKECLIKGDSHKDLSKSMYVEMLKDLMTIKCKHPECFGKIYPCPHVQLTKQEMNIAFTGNVNITINNNYTDDELVEFQKIDIYEDEKLNELMYNGLDGEAYSFAEIVYHFYKDQFNYGEDENWYIYENHKWRKTESKNITLRHMIQPKLKELYNELLGYYKKNDFEKNKIKTLKNIIKSFNNTTIKNNVMIELIEVYLENNNPKRNFTKKLDENKYLIGFDNGVYDLQKFEFRPGRPDDYITLSVGYDYKEIHTEKYKDLIKFLEDIQPNQNERNYMLTYLSISLIGNMLELFTILTGCGRNGKSKLIELLKVTLGDYFGSVPSQLFTRPRPDANSPDPGLLSLAKKRIVMASEPEKNSKLNSGFIKFITGRDSTTLRNCHSNDMIDFSPNFVTFLICNDIPECDDIDNAFSKRLRCINFPTEFVNEPKLEHQKKIDTNINENFEYWKMDFILLLIELYKKYTETKILYPTENILKWTNNYKEETDIYLHYLNECTEIHDSHIKTTDIYDNFKTWFKINNPGSKIPSNREFLANIKKYKVVEYVKIDKNSVYGIKNLKLIENNM